MKKNLLLVGLMLAGFNIAGFADDFVDDIYYNPSKNKTTKKASSKSYIKDFNSMDLDEYNRRGQYYTTPIDTIGSYAESGEDFVYTQKIQKFYNPTIVVENADLLESVLASSYGNVEVVYNINGPTFSSIYDPWYYGPTAWASYYPSSWAWNYRWSSPYWAASWNWGWNYGPSWSWSWNWGPTWSYGPGWSWGAGWGVPPHYHRPYGPTYAITPGRNHSLNHGWDRQKYTYNGGHVGGHNTSYGRPGTTRPSVGQSSTRPGTSRPSDNVRPHNNIGGNRGMTGNRGSVSGNRGTTNGNRVTSVPVNNGSHGIFSGNHGSSVGNRGTVSGNRGTTSGRGSSSGTSMSRPSGNSSNSSVSRPSGGTSNRSSGSYSGGSRGSSGGSRGTTGGRGGRR